MTNLETKLREAVEGVLKADAIISSSVAYVSYFGGTSRNLAVNHILAAIMPVVEKELKARSRGMLVGALIEAAERVVGEDPAKFLLRANARVVELEARIAELETALTRTNEYVKLFAQQAHQGGPHAKALWRRNEETLLKEK